MGFNWILYNFINSKFGSVVSETSENVFDYVTSQIDGWGSQNYAQQIKEFALGVASVTSLLPPALLYLMSVGFTLMLVGIIIRVILEII